MKLNYNLITNITGKSLSIEKLSNTLLCNSPVKAEVAEETGKYLN